MRVEEFIEARGHTKIRGTHRTTFEFTKEAHLNERGDCIIGVRASRGAADLSYEFRQILQNSNSRITMLLVAGEFSEVVRGFGSQKLLLTNRTDLVVRKSDYTCGRTLMVRADKAAMDLPRGLTALLRDPMCRIQVKLTAEDDSRQR